MVRDRADLHPWNRSTRTVAFRDRWRSQAMSKKTCRLEEIIAMLCQVEVLLGEGQ
jgi:hypothetical protein